MSNLINLFIYQSLLVWTDTSDKWSYFKFLITVQFPENNLLPPAHLKYLGLWGIISFVSNTLQAVGNRGNQMM